MALQGSSSSSAQAQQQGSTDETSPGGTNWDPWIHPHLQVQNTFLTISPPLSETPGGFMAVRRQISDPLSSRSSAFSSLASSRSNSRSNRPEDTSKDSKVLRSVEGSEDVGSLSSRSCSNTSRNSTLDAPRGKAAWLADFATSSGQAPQVGEDGQPESVGSALHAEGKCKPCAFHQTTSGCAMGLDCRFCHLEHKSSGKVRLRPCKGKRMRTKRMFDRLTTQIRKDPEGFDPEAIHLPPSIEHNSVVKGRLIGRLQEYADQARAGRSSASEGEEEEAEEEGDCPRSDFKHPGVYHGSGNAEGFQ